MNKLPVIKIMGDILLFCGAHLNLNPSHLPLDSPHSHSLLEKKNSFILSSIRYKYSMTQKNITSMEKYALIGCVVEQLGRLLLTVLFRNTT